VNRPELSARVAVDVRELLIAGGYHGYLVVQTQLQIRMHRLNHLGAMRATRPG
jgi:hypothetical protein